MKNLTWKDYPGLEKDKKYPLRVALNNNGEVQMLIPLDKPKLLKEIISLTESTLTASITQESD